MIWKGFCNIWMPTLQLWTCHPLLHLQMGTNLSFQLHLEAKMSSFEVTNTELIPRWHHPSCPHILCPMLVKPCTVPISQCHHLVCFKILLLTIHSPRSDDSCWHHYCWSANHGFHPSNWDFWVKIFWTPQFECDWSDFNKQTLQKHLRATNFLFVHSPFPKMQCIDYDPMLQFWI